MNLYKLHDNPKPLHGYEERNNIVPELIKKQIKSGKSANAQQLKNIASNPELAYWYAKYIIKGRFPEGEKAIASNPDYAYLYAKNIIKGRFPEGEKAIASSPYYALWYAKNVLKGRFPEGEPAIASDPWYAYLYAKYVIKGRFPADEKDILGSRHENLYCNLLPTQIHT